MPSNKFFKINDITFLSIVMAICLISSAKSSKAEIETSNEDCQGGHFLLADELLSVIIADK